MPTRRAQSRELVTIRHRRADRASIRPRVAIGGADRARASSCSRVSASARSSRSSRRPRHDRPRTIASLDDPAEIDAFAAECSARGRVRCTSSSTDDVTPMRAAIVGVALSHRSPTGALRPGPAGSPGAGPARGERCRDGTARPVRRGGADLRPVTSRRRGAVADISARARCWPTPRSPRSATISRSRRSCSRVTAWCWRGQDRTRRSSATCSTPRAPTTPSNALALEELGYRATTEEDVRGKGVKALPSPISRRPPLLTFAGERADLAGQLAPALGAALTKASLDGVYDELEQPLVPVLVDIEMAGVRVDVGVLREQGARLEAELDARAERIYAMAGERFNINSPKQLGDVLFTKLKLPVAQADGQGANHVHRPGRARGAGADPRSAARGPRLARAPEAERHLHRRAAAARAPGHGTRAHLVQPDDRGDGAPEQQRSEPAERADPHRDRPRDPPRVHRRSGLAADLRRLFADRAARARAPLRRPTAHRGVPAPGGHSRSDGAQGVRPRQRSQRARAAAARQDHQLRPALRQDGVHAGEGHRRHAAGGAGVHRRLFRGLPRGSHVSRSDHGAGARRPVS